MCITVYYLSDRTAITAEAFGKTLISQFATVTFQQWTFRYLDTVAKARVLLAEMDKKVSTTSSETPASGGILIFSTLVNTEIRSIFNNSVYPFFDLFSAMLPSVESAINVLPTISIGLTHSSGNDIAYESRMDAVNFAMSHDDGVSPQHYDQADIIITGVSRSGKTPTCLYLALHYGIFAANYPLTEEDFANQTLPNVLQENHYKVFALSIQADRLHHIRVSRRPNSHYSSLQQCKIESRKAEKMFSSAKFPLLDVTFSSVEEIATSILAHPLLNNNN